MKHVKEFKSQSNYETFKSGSSFVKPNVSLITDDYEVKYNPSFYVFTIEHNRVKHYRCNPGDTWDKWIFSDENDGTISINSDGYVCFYGEADRTLRYLGDKIHGGALEVTGDAIIDGAKYYFDLG